MSHRQPFSNTDSLGVRFFERLVSSYPQLSRVFAGDDGDDPRERLCDAIGGTLESIESLDHLKAMAADAGRTSPVVATLLELLDEDTTAGRGLGVALNWDGMKSSIVNRIDGARVAAPAKHNGAWSRDSSHQDESNMAPASATKSRRNTRKPAEAFAQLIENVPVAQVLVNSEGTVEGLNRAGRELFDRLTTELGFGATTLQSGGLQLILEALPQLSAILQGGSQAVQISDETLQVTVAPIDSEYSVHTWQVDDSTSHADSAELGRLRSMLDNMPTNVILANSDLVIEYLNPASVTKLKELQEFLPTPVDQIVGQSVLYSTRTLPISAGFSVIRPTCRTALRSLWPVRFWICW